MGPKKLHRFFIPTIPSEKVFTITDARIVHQLHTVLRFSTGKKFVVFTEASDDVVVTVVKCSRQRVEVAKEQTLPAREPVRRSLTVAVSITKRDTFELVVQKLTELGVRAIVPILSARTVKSGIRHDRLERISIEALEQSGGNKQVRIFEPCTLSEAMGQFSQPCVILDPTGSVAGDSPESSPELILYVGPEGGWTTEEHAFFLEHHAQLRRLGPNILRTETAAIVGAYEFLRAI